MTHIIVIVETSPTSRGAREERITREAKRPAAATARRFKRFTRPRAGGQDSPSDLHPTSPAILGQSTPGGPPLSASHARKPARKPPSRQCFARATRRIWLGADR